MTDHPDFAAVRVSSLREILTFVAEQWPQYRDVVTRLLRTPRTEEDLHSFLLAWMFDHDKPTGVRKTIYSRLDRLYPGDSTGESYVSFMARNDAESKAAWDRACAADRARHERKAR